MLHLHKQACSHLDMAVKSTMPPSSYWRWVPSGGPDGSGCQEMRGDRESGHREVWQRGCTEGSENMSKFRFSISNNNEPPSSQPKAALWTASLSKVVFWAVISLLCILQNVIYVCNMQYRSYALLQTPNISWGIYVGLQKVILDKWNSFP